MDTVARGEAIEADLDRFIAKRARKKGADSLEAEREKLWKESAWRYTARRRGDMRDAWHQHHTEQAERLRRTLETLIAHHENQAKLLMEG